MCLRKVDMPILYGEMVNKISGKFHTSDRLLNTLLRLMTALTDIPTQYIQPLLIVPVLPSFYVGETH